LYVGLRLDKSLQNAIHAVLTHLLAAVAQAKSSLVSLRSIQHKDAYGNPIGA
jgi:hypothetical protein